MQQEAPHELLGTERHGLVAGAAVLAVILPAERDAALIEGDEPAVGDRDPVGITGEVGKDCGRTCEGTLGIYDPFHLTQR